MTASGNVIGIAQARTTRVRTEAAHRSGVKTIGKKIMNNLAPAPAFSLPNGLTSMEEVGVPDQHLTTTGQKLLFFDRGFAQGLLPVFLEKTLGMGLRRNLFGVQS
jgi:hypothetical protein